jgi:hypothetical protein
MADSKTSDSTKKEDPQMDGEILGLCDQYTPEEEKAVLRKIDRVILPFVRTDSSLIYAVCEPNATAM